MASITTSYNWMIDKCNDENVGYSQDYRREQTVNGITYYDCSSMIWYALLYGGFDVVSANDNSSYPFTTSTMGAILEELGFTKYVATEVSWMAGDIVWRSGHTEMVYIPNRTMGAHSSTYDLPDQVSINKNDSNKNSWTYVYRYSGGIIPDPEPEPEPTPSTRRKMPVWLMCRGY